MAQEFLDRRHVAVGVQEMRRTRVTQPTEIHRDSHELGRCGILTLILAGGSARTRLCPSRETRSRSTDSVIV